MINAVKAVIAGTDLLELVACGDIEAVGRAQRVEEAVALTKKLRPDVLVTSLALRDGDGLGVLEGVSRLERPPVCVVLSTYQNRLIMAAVEELGGVYCVVRPGERAGTVMMIRRLVMAARLGEEKKAEEPELLDRVEDLMFTAGFPANLTGYRQLREAIMLAVREPETVNAVTKELYPAVAQITGSTPNRVERDIRTVIDWAWRRNPQPIARLVGPSISGKPTNSHLIASAAHALTRRRDAVGL